VGMNRDERTEAMRDLIVAIFRLAVADYLGLSYGHDGPDRPRRVRAVHQADAGRFLSGHWARWLAGLIGLRAGLVLREADQISSSGQRPDTLWPAA
jgi:hypothetical protein